MNIKKVSLIGIPIMFIIAMFLIICIDNKDNNKKIDEKEQQNEEENTSNIVDNPVTGRDLSNGNQSNSNISNSNVNQSNSNISNSNNIKSNSNNSKSNTNVPVKYVKTITKEEKKYENIKYGIRKVHVYKNTYDVYSNGTKKLKSSVETGTSIDYSSYNAKPKDLVSEAKSNLNNTKSLVLQEIEYVNEYRKQAGVKPLTYDENLCIYANVKVLDMYYGKYFAHTSKKGEPFGYIDKSIGIRTYAENIAATNNDPKFVTNRWYNSEGHKKNMLNPNYTKIGVGVKNGYWAQEFK